VDLSTKSADRLCQQIGGKNQARSARIMFCSQSALHLPTDYARLCSVSATILLA